MNIRQSSITGLRWNFLDQVSSQGTIFIVGIVLMNFVDPSEFGLIAMATVFVGILNLFSKFGLSASIVQTNSIEKREIDSILWFSVLIGVILSISLIMLSTPIGILYSEEKLPFVIKILSVGFILSPFSVIPLGILQRDMDFKRIFFINFSSNVLSGFLAIVLAIYGYGIWSLVFQRLSVLVFLLLISLRYINYVPSFNFSKVLLLPHLKFGMPYIGTKLFIYLIENMDNFLIGYYQGSRSLGFYSRAYSFATTPSKYLGSTIFRVLFPFLSRVQDDQIQTERIFRKINSAFLFIIIPLMLIISCTAEPFIYLFVGEKWKESIILLQLLALVAIPKINSRLFHNLLISQGRTKLDFKFNVIAGIATVSAFVIGLRYSLETMVLFYLAASMGIIIAYYILTYRVLKFNLRLAVFGPIVYTFIGGIVFFLSAYIKEQIGFLPYYLQLGILTISVLAMWLILAIIFLPKETKTVYNTLKSLIK